jgi:hypothetical protein
LKPLLRANSGTSRFSPLRGIEFCGAHWDFDHIVYHFSFPDEFPVDGLISTLRLGSLITATYLPDVYSLTPWKQEILSGEAIRKQTNSTWMLAALKRDDFSLNRFGIPKSLGF